MNNICIHIATSLKKRDAMIRSSITTSSTTNIRICLLTMDVATFPPSATSRAIDAATADLMYADHQVQAMDRVEEEGHRLVLIRWQLPIITRLASLINHLSSFRVKQEVLG